MSSGFHITNYIPKKLLRTSLYKRLYSLYRDFQAKYVLLEAKRHLISLHKIDNPLFIVVIPGSLHLVEICLRFVPQNISTILINNGLSDWESDFSRKHLNRAGIINIPRMIEHGQVIDFLLAGLDQPFTILDYDCFVFKTSIFSEMTVIESGQMMNAIFAHRNEVLKLDVPETFMLTLDPKIIRQLQSTYHVTSKMQDFCTVPVKARHKLSTIGIDAHHYPEEYKSHFDTMRLLFALGLAEGYKCNFIRRIPTVCPVNDEIFHIGGSTDNSNSTIKWQMRGSYFWRRALEECPYPELKAYYSERFGLLSPYELLKKNPALAMQIKKEFFSIVEDIVHYSDGNQIVTSAHIHGKDAQ